MNITVTHPVSNFTGNVTLADGAVVLGFTSGSCQQDVNPAYFGAIKSAGLSYVIGAPNPAPPYDANMDVVTAAIVGSSSSSTSGALRAAYVTPNAIRVADYGTLGTADDSATITAALAAANGRRLIFPPNTTLNVKTATANGLSNTIIDGNGCTLQLVGVNAVGLTLAAGTYSNVEIRSLRIIGSGVVTDAQTGINCPSGSAVTGMRVIDCRIESVTVGVSFNADGAGSLTGLLYQGNYLKNIIGTGVGQGYGLHWAVSDTAVSAAVRCLGNTIVSAQRHSIYSGKARGVSIVANQIYNHRDASLTSDIRPAINIARSADVLVSGNVVKNAAGGALYLGGLEGGALQGPYVAVGNAFTNPLDSAALVYIGEQAPGTDGIPIHVEFAHNTLTSATSNRLMTVFNGKHLRIVGNHFQMPSGGSNTALALQGTGVTGNDYMDQVDVLDNRFDIGTNDVIRLSGTETLTVAMRFRGNRAPGSPYLFTPSVAVTNPNIEIADQPFSGMSFSGASAVKPYMAGPSTTTAPSAGGAGALPATPTGYLTVNVNGTDRVVPYY